jgi:nucleoside-diphosphate-sugar epimerase
MRVLILGGTIFLGRHVVDEALRRGHELTLFTRGKHGTGPTGVEHVAGDRADVTPLRGDVAGTPPSIRRVTSPDTSSPRSSRHRSLRLRLLL